MMLDMKCSVAKCFEKFAVNGKNKTTSPPISYSHFTFPVLKLYYYYDYDYYVPQMIEILVQLESPRVQ